MELEAGYSYHNVGGDSSSSPLDAGVAGALLGAGVGGVEAASAAEEVTVETVIGASCGGALALGVLFFGIALLLEPLS